MASSAAITAASSAQPAHLSSERKYGAAIRHTVASVEPRFFKISVSGGMALGLRNGRMELH
jgi:hypothetical protein